MDRNVRAQGRDTNSPDFTTDTCFGEVKSGVSATRTVRDTLVKLVKGLVRWQHKTAYLVLVDPRVTVASLEDELRDFKAAIRPEIEARLKLVIVRDRRIENIPADISPSDMEVLSQQIETAAVARSPLSRPDKQSEVLRVILHQWFLGRGPMTFDWIAKTVGCTYRTVATVIENLGPAIERQGDRRVMLKYFPGEAWARFIAVSRSARATANYIDRSDQPRSPESLFRRLQSLGRTDIAVGGVIGAKHYYPGLDMTSAPRLDICIHAHGKYADLEFMEKLDPALTRASSPFVPIRVSVHFSRRSESLFTRDESGDVWADPVECLADLIEARLDPQASDFQAYLSKQAERLSGRD